MLDKVNTGNDSGQKDSKNYCSDDEGFAVHIFSLCQENGVLQWGQKAMRRPKIRIRTPLEVRMREGQGRPACGRVWVPPVPPVDGVV